MKEISSSNCQQGLSYNEREAETEEDKPAREVKAQTLKMSHFSFLYNPDETV